MTVDGGREKGEKHGEEKSLTLVNTKKQQKVFPQPPQSNDNHELNEGYRGVTVPTTLTTPRNTSQDKSDKQ